MKGAEYTQKKCNKNTQKIHEGGHFKKIKCGRNPFAILTPKLPPLEGIRGETYWAVLFSRGVGCWRKKGPFFFENLVVLV